MSLSLLLSKLGCTALSDLLGGFLKRESNNSVLGEPSLNRLFERNYSSLKGQCLTNTSEDVRTPFRRFRVYLNSPPEWVPRRNSQEARLSDSG